MDFRCFATKTAPICSNRKRARHNRWCIETRTLGLENIGRLALSRRVERLLEKCSCAAHFDCGNESRTLRTRSVGPHSIPLADYVPIDVAVMISKQNRIARAWGEVQDLESTLRRFGAVFRYLERGGVPARRSWPRRALLFYSGQATVCLVVIQQQQHSVLGANALLWLIVNASVPWDFFFFISLEWFEE